jgi:hypothetical protein
MICKVPPLSTYPATASKIIGEVFTTKLNPVFPASVPVSPENVFVDKT